TPGRLLMVAGNRLSTTPEPESFCMEVDGSLSQRLIEELCGDDANH
ncbi:MAG: hypothetical protein ACI8P0_006531, partial [Planctomycetaceae bacterium]